MAWKLFVPSFCSLYIELLNTTQQKLRTINQSSDSYARIQSLNFLETKDLCTVMAPFQHQSTSLLVFFVRCFQ